MACNGMPIFSIESNKYLQYLTQLLVLQNVHDVNYIVVTYGTIFKLNRFSTFLQY